MRKGILSLSLPGRKKKTSNMEHAEQAAVKQAEAAKEPKPDTKEKAYVQTIMVPKPNTDVKKQKRKKIGISLDKKTGK